jgi:hypothetical protein
MQLRRNIDTIDPVTTRPALCHVVDLRIAAVLAVYVHLRSETHECCSKHPHQLPN